MNQNEDDFFKKLISESKLEMPFPDFEETVMMKIKEEIYHQKAMDRYIKLSWVFVIVAIIVGICSLLLISKLKPVLSSIQFQYSIIIFELLFVVIVLSQFETLLKFTFKGKEEVHDIIIAEH